MTFYNEVELEWHQLPEARKKYWTERGYDAEKWENEEDKLHDCIQTKGDENAKPAVIKMPLKDLCHFDFSYFEGVDDKKVTVRAGAKDTDDETPVATIGLKEFLAQIQEGKTDYKFQIEDVDNEKDMFQELGSVITSNIKQGLINSELGGNDGMFKREWQKKDSSDFNWSVWMGAKGTQTPMHFDTELFNFLYVVEGKKRVVLIPNDHRTEGMFKIHSYYSGSAWTGEDILNQKIDLPGGSVDVEVGPGEGICIPYRWWHAVKNLENTLAYGFRVLE